jgi:hypothetical protein
VPALSYSLNMAAILVVKFQEKCLLNIPCHLKSCFLGAGMAQSVQRRATDWRARIRFPTAEREFSLLHSVQIGSGLYWALCAIGNNGSFPGGKRPRREAGHSPPSSVEVKNTLLPHIPSWRYAILTQSCIHLAVVCATPYIWQHLIYFYVLWAQFLFVCLCFIDTLSAHVY